MFDPLTITIITSTFLLAGLVKGVIGLGLPTISLGLLVATFDLTTAMTLLIVPSFATNLWQAFAGSPVMVLVRRLWPFLLLATITVWTGSIALEKIDLSLLSMLLGGLLIIYSLLSLSGFQPGISPQKERWAAPLLGGINGILTGMTGSFVVPGVMYLQSIGLSRDQLVQAMGLLFTVSTLALAVSLQYRNFTTGQLNLASLAAVLPAALGMWLGQRIRQKLSEQIFRKIFFISILILGVYLIIQTYSA